MTIHWRQVLPALAAGLLAGAALGRWAHRHHGGERHFTRMVESFSRELDLTPEQRTRLEAVLEAKRRSFRALHDELRPRFEELRRSAKEEIAAILTPDQRPRFEKVEAEWAAKRAKRHAERR